MTTCQQSHWVDAHFERRIDLAGEQALREHLAGCDACRGRYERWALYEKLALPAHSRDGRLAHALGFSPRTTQPTRFLVMALAASTALVTFGLAASLITSREPAFQARGAGAAKASIAAYALRGGNSVRITNSISAADELAFTYTNPSGHKALLLFATDTHGHVYWFAPTWAVASERPTAVAVTAAREPTELPRATRHAWDSERIELHAVFTDEQPDVVEVERRLAQHLPAAIGHEVTLNLEVHP